MGNDAETDELSSPPSETDAELERQQAALEEQLSHHREKLGDEADRIKRELALLRSGVDLNHPAGKLFRRALEKSRAWNETVPTAEEIRSTAIAYSVPLEGE